MKRAQNIAVNLYLSVNCVVFAPVESVVIIVNKNYNEIMASQMCESLVFNQLLSLVCSIKVVLMELCCKR